MARKVINKTRQADALPVKAMHTELQPLGNQTILTAVTHFSHSFGRGVSRTFAFDQICEATAADVIETTIDKTGMELPQARCVAVTNRETNAELILFIGPDRRETLVVLPGKTQLIWPAPNSGTWFAWALNEPVQVELIAIQ